MSTKGTLGFMMMLLAIVAGGTWIGINLLELKGLVACLLGVVIWGSWAGLGYAMCLLEALDANSAGRRGYRRMELL